jgi:pseudouridine-5'-phosphate glycosidase
MHPSLHLSPETAKGIELGQPFVALESTLIAHGLPYPRNLQTARAAEETVRQFGACPATIAMLQGRIHVGLTHVQLQELATSKEILKASRRDLAACIALKRSAATTVAATMFLAHQAGIQIFATGGIGGVHRDVQDSFDISADLIELSRTPVAVVCSGAKNILDLPKTLEMLEMLGVPVIGYRTEWLPAFYVQSSGCRLEWQLDTPNQVARLLHAHWQMQGAGVVIVQPPPPELALPAQEFRLAMEKAEREAQAQNIRGKQLTPFLLQRLAVHTQGRSLEVNCALILENASLAAQISLSLSRL